MFNVKKGNGSVFKNTVKNYIAKTFPNLDPDFFKSPFLVSKNKDVVSDPYLKNTWVYAACSAITTNLLQVPWVLDLRSSVEQDFITDHPILDVLNNPNPMMSKSSFEETLLLNLLLPTSTTKGGQCFLLMESLTDQPVSLKRGDIPKEIYPFSDNNIRPVVDKDDANVLLGWQLEIDNKKVFYKTDELIRINLVDPSHPLKGQCPLWAAMSALRIDEKAVNVNESFFDNNASLGGALQTDAEMDSEDVKMLKQDWEETYGGQQNSGKTAVLHSGIKYEQFQRTHVDMQYLDQRKFSRDEILAVYRVPKAEVSIYEDVNYATALSADKSFWKKTLLPLDKRVLEAFNSQWIQYIKNKTYILVSDISNVEALQENFGEKLKQAKEMAEMHIPMVEINRRLELNLQIDDYPWLATSLVNFSLTPAENVMEKEDEPVDDEATSVSDPDNEAPEDVMERLEWRIDKIHKDEEAKDNFINNYNKKVRDPDERRFKKLIDKFFVGQRNRYQDKIDAWAKSAGSKSVTKIDKEPPKDFYKLDGAKEAITLRKLLLPEYRKQIFNETTQMEEEIGPFVQWNKNHPSIKRMLKKRLKEIKGINGTTNKKVAKQIQIVIEKSIKEKLTVQQTAKLLKEGIRKVYKGDFRAKTIARTETGIIHSETRNEVMKAEGVEKQEWLTSTDERVRSASDPNKPPAPFPHDILHTKIVKIGTPFNNGENIMYPLDTNASASNIINCRCVAVKAAK